MVRRAYRQRSLVEVLLPDGDKLWDPTLRQIDTLLDDDVLIDRVTEALAQRHPQSQRRGRLGTPATVVLRMLVLKHLSDWTFDECEREVRGSLVYRAFCRIDGERVPDAKTLIRLARLHGSRGAPITEGVVTVQPIPLISDGDQSTPSLYGHPLHQRLPSSGIVVRPCAKAARSSMSRPDTPRRSRRHASHLHPALCWTEAQSASPCIRSHSLRRLLLGGLRYWWPQRDLAVRRVPLPAIWGTGHIRLTIHRRPYGRHSRRTGLGRVLCPEGDSIAFGTSKCTES